MGLLFALVHTWAPSLHIVGEIPPSITLVNGKAITFIIVVAGDMNIGNMEIIENIYYTGKSDCNHRFLSLLIPISL